MIDIFNSSVCTSIHNAFEKIVLCTDDGHGWNTPGKQSFDGSLRENEFNSSVEAKLLLLLHSCGIKCYQLAPGWKDEDLPARTKLENEIYNEAKLQKKRLIGISIHADAFNDTSAEGFCVYYYKKNNTYSREGKRLAKYIADSIIDNDRRNGHIIKPRHDNGICGENFHMLRESSGTWILIENAFMTNNHDLDFLKEDAFRNNRAMAILEGLFNYVSHL